MTRERTNSIPPPVMNWRQTTDEDFDRFVTSMCNLYKVFQAMEFTPSDMREFYEPVALREGVMIIEHSPDNVSEAEVFAHCGVLSVDDLPGLAYHCLIYAICDRLQLSQETAEILQQA